MMNAAPGKSPGAAKRPKKGRCGMTEKRIRKIKADIEVYRQAIESAEGALAEAERELEEEFELRYFGEN
jgi:hypothetical protein